MQKESIFKGLAISLAVMALAGTASAAEDVKIATVDMQKALQTVDSGRRAKAQLEKEFNSKKTQLQTEEASIKKMTEEFQKQSLVMSDEARAKKQAELQQRIMKFQELTARSQVRDSAKRARINAADYYQTQSDHC